MILVTYFLVSWILAAFECHTELILEKKRKKALENKIFRVTYEIIASTSINTCDK